jgi:NADH-quinone oxidoreductase subunit L
MNYQVAISPGFSLVPWVVFSPVIGLLLNILIGKRLGEALSGWLATLASAASFVVAGILFFTLQSSPQGATVPFLEWIHIGTFQADWAFRVDALSVTMMLVVSGVGTLIHNYAIGYMHSDVRHNGDPARFTRFFVYLNLFIAAMMILVSADNYLMLFVG